MRLLSPFPFITLGCSAAALAGCGDGASRDTAASDAGMGSAPAAAPAPMISLADVAGRWRMRSTPVTGSDTTPTTWTLTATERRTGWSIHFPDRQQPVRVRAVSVSGDSLVADVGPYTSARRKGLQVRTHTVLRLEDGRLVGNTLAHYRTQRADSVLMFLTEGTRAGETR